MLKKQLEQYIADQSLNDPEKIELHKVEKEYAEKHQLLPTGVEVVLKDATSIFSDAYLERCEKETVALIIVETPKFLEEKIEHLKTHMNEFLYVESKSFDLVSVDAVSLEVDDVFKTYTAMIGLKMKKKYESAIKEYLDANLSGEAGKFSVAFSGKDGLFDMNFALNYATGFNEEMTLLEAYDLIYSFVFSMVAEIEDAPMNSPAFIYTYVRHGDEYDLCQLEMRSFFGFDWKSNVLLGDVKIDPSRSPFMKERLEVLYDAESWDSLVQQVRQLDVSGTTFKVICMNTMDLDGTKKIEHADRRKIEREIGLQINGEPDLFHPESVYGFLVLDGHWYFGEYVESESVWYRHQKKPHSYSTALSTRVARAVANIAVPNPDGLKVIDPCCGIGNVLVEALSMGIDIVGRDINPLVIEPAKENIAYFRLPGDVEHGAIADVVNKYDVAIIDMPYNIFSEATPDDQLDILRQARRIADRVIVVTIDTIDHMIEEVGFTISDRCEAKKGLFVRQVLVCE